jgi:hypothetical protein
VRLGEGLEARREVRCLADNALFLCRAVTDQLTDHHHSGCDADPRRQGFSGWRGELAHRGDHCEPGADRTLRLVLVRPGITEVGEDSIAHEFGDVALEADKLARHRIVIRADQRAHVLGIEPSRQLGRADQIDEHHRQLPAFGFARNRPRRGWRSHLCPLLATPGIQRRYRLEQPLAVAEVEPKLLQIDVRQIAQDVPGDAVLCEQLRVMSELLLGEPARDVEHFGPQAIAWKDNSTPILAATAVSRCEVWAPERNRRRTPLLAVPRAAHEAFRISLAYQDDQTETRNINWLATASCSSTLPQPSSFGPGGYREFESSPSANTAYADSLSVC